MLTQCHAKCRVPVQHLQVDLLLVLPFSMPGCVILAELERVYVQLCMSALLLYPCVNINITLHGMCAKLGWCS